MNAPATPAGANAEQAAYTEDFAHVLAEERTWLARRRAAAGRQAPAGDVVGLAFSGGGIRSATFNLGVLQALEAGNLMPQVDYLSTVSGGGYIGSCYTWLRANLGKLGAGASVFAAQLADGSGSVLDWLRGHGKYLTSHRGFSIWTLLASVFAATFANVLVLGPPLVFGVYGMTLGWLPVEWPDWLALPGSSPPQEQHGYWLLLIAGVLCLAALPIAATLFAFVAGMPRLIGVHQVDRLRVLMGRLLVFGPVLIAIGLIPVAAMLGEWAENHFAMRHAHAIGKHTTYLAPLISGLASVVLDRWKTGNASGRLTMIGLSLVMYGILMLCYHIAATVDLLHSPLYAACVIVAVVMAFACNINRVSIHAYYRARLSDAFLPRVAGGLDQDPGDFDLRQLTPDNGAPLHLINTTINTTSSRNERRRARQGASFAGSPLYVGGEATGWRRIDSYAHGQFALSTAMTTSGAAVDPNMWATKERALSALMALFNVRLGFWGHNPRCANERDPLRPWWWVFILREMLGVGLDDRSRHVHLSDGGGFENLGVYELIRRRVRWLIVTDAGADPTTTLGDLGQAIERVRVDFGAEIDLNADTLYHQRDQQLMQRPFALGTIRYVDGSRGDILYIRPVLCAGLSADIYAYWRAHAAFPDEPTSDQFFAEAQFEAYRVLGREIVGDLLGAEAPPNVEEWFARLRQVVQGRPA